MNKTTSEPSQLAFHYINAGGYYTYSEDLEGEPV